MEGLELELGVRWDFSAQQLSLLYWGRGLIPSCWSRSPEDQAQAGSVFFRCVLSPLPAPGPLPQVGGAEARGGGLHGRSAHVSYRQRSELSPVCCPGRHQQLLPLLCSDAALSAGKVHLTLSNAFKLFFFYCFNRVLESLLRKPGLLKGSLICGCLLKSAVSRFTLIAAKRDQG